MIKWKRKSGTTLDTNELPATIAHCEAQGWERVEEKKAAPKKTKPTKAKVKATSDERDS